MQTLYKSLLVTTLCAAVSVFIFADVSQANGGGSGSSKVKVKVRAELEPFDGSPDSDAEGKARHKKETRTRDGVTKIKKDEFKATVKIPVPSPALGITEDNAENADIRLILSNAGGNFANCQLEFDEIDEDDDDEMQAEFKVDVRLKKGTVRDKRGTCDGSVPDAQAGDVATATFGPGPTPFLRGTFEQHH